MPKKTVSIFQVGLSTNLWPYKSKICHAKFVLGVASLLIQIALFIRELNPTPPDNSIAVLGFGFVAPISSRSAACWYFKNGINTIV